jgi:hypothetical protein
MCAVNLHGKTKDKTPETALSLWTGLTSPTRIFPSARWSDAWLIDCHSLTGLKVNQIFSDHDFTAALSELLTKTGQSGTCPMSGC